MATTKNGIYYPSDGTQPADVLGDMKKMAESIDENIQDNKYDPTTSNKDITALKKAVNDIKKEQTTQNDNIEKNTAEITALQEENANLRAQIPTGTAAGEEISLSDSAEMELVDFGLQGNSYQEVEDGKNKAIIPDREETFNGMSINIKNGIINITGKSSVTYTSYRIVGSAELEAGKTYYLRLFGNKNGSASLRNDTESVWFPDSENNENQFTPTVGGTYNIQLGFGSGENQNWNVRYSISETSNADWVEGKEATPTLVNPSVVQAVGDSGSAKITESNKNLAKIILTDKWELTENGIKNKGWINAVNLTEVPIFKGQILKLNLVLLSSVAHDTTFSIYINDVYTPGYNFTSLQKMEVNTLYTRTINVEEDGILRITAWQNSSEKEIFEFQLWVEEDKVTEYIKHEEKIYTIPIQKPFYKIGDYADTFIKQDNKCYEQHYIKEYIFTGNENWFDGGTTTNNQYICSNPFEDANKSILGNYNDDIVSPVLSNYFISIGNRPNNAGSVGISFVNFTNGETHLRVGVGLNSEYNTLELFKQKLQELNAAGTPVKMYYILSTPELIECTEEQTQVLEQIIKDGTYKEVTHFYTKEDLKPTIELTYYKDLETLFNKQAELENTLNNVQAQILELGGN